MAASTKPTDGTISFIKVARALTYLVYFFAVTAIVFLSLGFVLLLFGANTSVPFVRFVYHIAAEFLAPFRGIFPPHQISDTSYFSSAGLFAIVMYSFFAAAVHSLINYITLKEVTHEKELIEAQRELERLQKRG
ncbi:MAG: hypothetical protein AAB436_02980 [Patescibacteria group bacterium]